MQCPLCQKDMLIVKNRLDLYHERCKYHDAYYVLIDINYLIDIITIQLNNETEFCYNILQIIKESPDKEKVAYYLYGTPKRPYSVEYVNRMSRMKAFW